MTGTWLSIIPPLLAIGFAIWTRKVFLALLIGIISGSFLISNLSIVDTVIHTFQTIFIQVADIEWNIPIILFVLILGGLTSLLANSGATIRFSNWALSRVKNRVAAQFVAFFTGIAIFIDDYFNSLAVGQIARPITDVHGVSRAKLAYIIDSTGAPICILIPLSSWGAYIFSLLHEPIQTYQLGVEPFTAFIMIVPANYYAIMALLIGFLTIYWRLDFPLMRTHEEKALHDLKMNPHKEEVAKTNFSDAADLLVPIFVLIVSTILIFVYSGGYFTSSISLMEATGEGNIVTSLVYGGIFAIITAAILYIPQGKVPAKQFLPAFLSGAGKMLTAVLILVLAWSVGAIIEQLETGMFLSSLVQDRVPLWIIPLILFLLACAMAFATGTSWGTFAIMIPIGVSIIGVIHPEWILPVVGAVLAGSVFGDHCSPISDSTILSSIGAECNLMDHVTTQIPYALTAAVASAIGYIVFGLTSQVWLGLLGSTVILIIILLVLKSRTRPISV